MKPIISVIVPCRNEKDHIEACVRSILAQELPSEDFELIVVDGMSDDGTREILERIANQNSQIKLFDNPRMFKSFALNVGIRAARGRNIAVMDAHNRYSSDYLRQSVQVLEERQVDNAGGCWSCVADSYMQQAIALAHVSPFAVGGARCRDPNYDGPSDTVFGGVYRREVFDHIGLFDEELVRNQDDEFNLRLIRAGGKIWQSTRIRSWYRPRGSLAGLFKQYMQYGYWKVRVIQKHKIPASIRHLVPGCFVFLLMVLPIAFLWWPGAAWLWLALLVAYTAGTVSASLITAARHGWKYLFILPLVFACYHFAYGFGFLRGIYDFVIRRRGPAIGFSKLTRPSGSS